MAEPDITVDILVVGAGAAGLSAALALANSGYEVATVGALEAAGNGRTVALFEGSLRFLRTQKLWPHLSDIAAKIVAIELIDATNAPVPIASLTFAAEEVGLQALGANIENSQLVPRLADLARQNPNIHLTEEWLDDIVYGEDIVSAHFTSGRRINAKLIVAADGQRSTVRKKAGIGTRRWTYPQVALTVLLAHELPHHDRSIEFHTRSGPCTLVPLLPRAEAPHRSSLVWLIPALEAERRKALAPAALAAEIAAEVEEIFSAMRLDSDVGFFPMAGMRVARLTGRRIALLGEAAHAFPPLAAQGLNLSLRDISALVACVDAARAAGQDIGGAPVLRRYAEAREPDIDIRIRGVDVLNRSMLTDFLPVDLARGLGALAMSAIGPLRRAALLEGILPDRPHGRPHHPSTSLP
ncbi:MAG: FAD-dependent monooxygenase [Methylovirgula sp.]